ncbi:jerky protein homolog-like [Sitophilus oryzae]|uniref:Jerky protein homolog-like n=1 Tax=Sitophilus oryzae TaxID=7048 RepID=A0A6J2XTN6_SITOR|nr:jerky protein homolog-like [Sitophilus oryzae]
MVRDYKRKPGSRNYRNYNEAQLEEALRKVVEGSMTMRTASQEYKIPFGTLNNKFHGRNVKMAGGQSIFSHAEEIAILNAVVKCADWGFPLSMLELRMFAKSFLDQSGRKIKCFQNNLPGKDWVRSLLKRHNTSVAQRVSANINKERASISRDTINKYFDNLKETVKDIPPQNIFNYDETNVNDEPGKGKGIYRRGVKYPEKIANHSKSATTIMVCGSADGTLLPPYIIYKSEHLYNTWRENGPKGYPCCNKACCAVGCRFNRTSHGWMDSSTFQDWFESSFLPHARRLEGKKILIGDNLASHFSETVIRLCEENDVAFVCLVPHSTHICQPLDVSFFRPMKTAWRAILTNYKMKHSRQSGIPKDVFPSLLRESLEKMDSVSTQTKHKSGDGEVSAIKRNLINGFEATGIYPFNAQKVLIKIPGDNDPAQEVNEVLTQFLKEKRYGDDSERAPRKKKTRLIVEPGKSVTADNASSSEDEAQYSPIHLSDNENDNTPNEDVVEEVTNYLKPTLDLLIPDTFVLVRYLQGKRKSIWFKYVCVVKEKYSDSEFTVAGLKSVNSDHNVFSLVKNDISTVPIEDILAVLPNPIFNKEMHYQFPHKIDVLEL